MKAKTKTASVSKFALALKLEIPAGFGFTAEVTEDGFLQIQQANQDGDLTDTLVLTKAEARRLFQAFQSWTAS